MLQEIKTMQDVTTFIVDIATEIGDYNPFADFNNFINPATNEPVYTDEEADLRKRLLEECFEVCGQQCPNFIYLFIVVLQDARDNIVQLQSQLTTIHNRSRIDYFKSCTTVVEIKTRYLQLADEYNFYRGGDVKTIERINEEYTKACEPIIMHSATSEDNLLEQFQRVEWYIETISLLLMLTSIKIEIIDGYLWVSTEDYHSGREIREAGLTYSKNKQAWFCPL